MQLPDQECRLSNDELMALFLEKYPRLPERIVAMDIAVSDLDGYSAYNPIYLATGFALVAACSDDGCDLFAIEDYIKATSSGLMAHRDGSWIFDSQVGFVRQVALWFIETKPSCCRRVLAEIAPLLFQQYVGRRFLSVLLDARLRGTLDNSLFSRIGTRLLKRVFREMLPLVIGVIPMICLKRCYLRIRLGPILILGQF